jgi:hypothetical protein
MFRSYIIELIKTNSPYILVIIGLLLLIIGANGGWPQPYLCINEIIWRIILAVMGFIVSLTGIFIIIREKKDRKTISVKNYGIKILSPEKNQGVGDRVDITGIFEKWPEHQTVKLFIKSPKTNEYWPQPKPISIDKNKESWKGQVYMGCDIGKERNIVIALINEGGQSLCDYYEKVGKKTNQWIGVQKLPNDVIECDSVLVIRQELTNNQDRRRTPSDI